jgi:hypothetical protein
MSGNPFDSFGGDNGEKVEYGDGDGEEVNNVEKGMRMNVYGGWVGGGNRDPLPGGGILPLNGIPESHLCPRV